MQLVATRPHVRSYTPQHVKPRTHPHVRRLFGALMLVAGVGLVVVGARAFAERGITPGPVVDGLAAGSAADFVAPWALAVVLLAAAAHLLRRPSDRMF